MTSPNAEVAPKTSAYDFLFGIYATAAAVVLTLIGSMVSEVPEPDRWGEVAANPATGWWIAAAVATVAAAVFLGNAVKRVVLKAGL